MFIVRLHRAVNIELALSCVFVCGLLSSLPLFPEQLSTYILYMCVIIFYVIHVPHYTIFLLFIYFYMYFKCFQSTSIQKSDVFQQKLDHHNSFT